MQTIPISILSPPTSPFPNPFPPITLILPFIRILPTKVPPPLLLLLPLADELLGLPV